MKKDMKLRAFSDPTRIAIIRCLLEGPKYISDLIQETGIPRSTLVYNLSFFEKDLEGLVKSEYNIIKRGSVVVGKKYSLNKKMLKELLNYQKELFANLK